MWSKQWESTQQNVDSSASEINWSQIDIAITEIRRISESKDIKWSDAFMEFYNSQSDYLDSEYQYTTLATLVFCRLRDKRRETKNLSSRVQWNVSQTLNQ